MNDTDRNWHHKYWNLHHVNTLFHIWMQSKKNKRENNYRYFPVKLQWDGMKMSKKPVSIKSCWFFLNGWSHRNLFWKVFNSILQVLVKTILVDSDTFCVFFWRTFLCENLFYCPHSGEACWSWEWQHRCVKL